MGGFDIDISPGEAGDEGWKEEAGPVEEENSAEVWNGSAEDYGNWEEEPNIQEDDAGSDWEWEALLPKEIPEEGISEEAISEEMQDPKEGGAISSAVPYSASAPQTDRNLASQPDIAPVPPDTDRTLPSDIALTPSAPPVSMTPVPSPEPTPTSSPTVTPKYEQKIENNTRKVLKYYNNNNDFRGEQKTEKCRVDFIYGEMTSEETVPEIEVVSKGALSILSFRLNGKECPWHWEENRIVAERKPENEENKIELTAVLDGKDVIEMTPWIF